jgi:hypothetical protein
VLPGTNLTLTVTLGAVAPAVGTPTGSVLVCIDGAPFSTNAIVAGVATCTINSLGIGSHTVLAEYPGDANFTGTTNALAQNQIVNFSPAVTNCTVVRTPNTALKLRLAMLLACATNSDGTPLTVAVNALSANNVAITTNNGWVFYTPPAGMTNNDSFTFTVSDSLGGTGSGTVNIVVQETSQGENLSIQNLGGGSYQITGSGIPGDTYRVQYSDSLAPANWQFLTGISLTADAGGNFSFTDNSGDNSPTRFYRTVYP